MAKELALLPPNKISTIINMLSPPMMAELQTNVEAMRDAFYRGVRLTAAISLPASVGIALVADQMVAALLGSKWLPAIPIMRLLCLYATTAIEPLLTPVLFARRRQQFLFWYFVVQLTAVTAAMLVGALWNGQPAPS